MDLSSSLKKIPHLSSISAIALEHNINIWLVGGFLRDIYLKKRKELLDFDFCVAKNTFSVVKEFSKKISSKFIVLDKEQESLRVILKRKKRLYTYDFTLMRGKNFNEDLLSRDFSINTLAVNLKERKKTVIDNFGAKSDLKSKTIRVINEKVIPDDPLRILRGFAFATNYGFHIESKTLKSMVKFRHSLKRVSRERVNEELFKILAADDSFKTIKALDKLKIIDEIIPDVNKLRGVFQGAYHHLDVWQHSLETLRQFEVLLQKKLTKKKDILSYLNEELAVGRRRLHIIKLACILHDFGKPFAKKKLKKRTIFHTHEKIGRDLADNIAQNLRLSLREKDILKKLVFWHLRPGYLADQITPSKRAVYRFFRDTQSEGAAVIFLSLADWRATRGPLTNATKRKRHEKIMLDLVDSYFKDRKREPLPRIVDGYDIMRKFKLKSSPLIGAILKEIKEEQSMGKITTKTQGYKVAKEMINKAKLKK